MAVNRDLWFKFCPTDWRGDDELQSCSLAAKGLWVELLCVAHKGGGYVLINRQAPSVEQLAKLVGSKSDEVANCLQELITFGVCAQQDGVIVSRRMVRDAKRRKANRRNGKRGGNPALINTRLSGGLSEDGRQKLEARSKKLEIKKDPTAIVVGVFPVKGGRWELTDRQVALWRDTYPKIDVLGECKKAKAWLESNPAKQKRPTGMPRFLVGWLNRSESDAPSRLSATPRAVYSAPPEPAYDFAWEDECRRTCKTPCQTAYQHSVRKPVAS